jgi:hypothetical protein
LHHVRLSVLPDGDVVGGGELFVELAVTFDRIEPASRSDDMERIAALIEKIVEILEEGSGIDIAPPNSNWTAGDLSLIEQLPSSGEYVQFMALDIDLEQVDRRTE